MAIFDRQGAADRVGRDVRTIRRWEAKGLLTFVLDRVRESDLLEAERKARANRGGDRRSARAGGGLTGVHTPVRMRCMNTSYCADKNHRSCAGIVHVAKAGQAFAEAEHRPCECWCHADSRPYINPNNNERTSFPHAVSEYRPRTPEQIAEDAERYARAQNG